MMNRNHLVVVRGAGDIATGTIYRLYQAGFGVIALDIEKPTVIRRTVSFAQALYDKTMTVEGVTAIKCTSDNAVIKVLEENMIPICIDPKGDLIKRFKPMVVVDAILAKRNLGTFITMAPVVIALGPGYTAGVDAHAVIETERGHHLGRTLYEGSPAKNTGIPGNIGGYTHERVIHAQRNGVLHNICAIGDLVISGKTIAEIEGVPVKAKISGILRGLMAEGSQVVKGLKIADIDPRGDKKHCYTISDKARNISGGVLEAILHLTQIISIEDIDEKKERPYISVETDFSKSDIGQLNTRMAVL